MSAASRSANVGLLSAPTHPGHPALCRTTVADPRIRQGSHSNPPASQNPCDGMPPATTPSSPMPSTPPVQYAVRYSYIRAHTKTETYSTLY
ncbi:hypothetical protein OPQ81_011683 [Rhizoctonia solani]|nr:hypothetical protein OPQ81_011683 [Rhizoctonia solani]